jgi:hypothetical protein
MENLVSNSIPRHDRACSCLRPFYVAWCYFTTTLVHRIISFIIHFDPDVPELAVSVPNPGNLVRTNEEDYIIEVESYVGV